jgi:hypothetical protein
MTQDNDKNEDAGKPAFVGVWSRRTLGEQEAAERDRIARDLVLAQRKAEMFDVGLPLRKRAEAARRLLKADLVGLLTADERQFAEMILAHYRASLTGRRKR